MASQVIRVDALRSTAYGSITDSYVPLGIPFAHPMRTIRLVNTTDALLFISFDGTTDNLVLPAGSFVLYDGTANTEFNSRYFVFAITTQVYVEYVGSSPTSGAVYVECIYGRGE